MSNVTTFGQLVFGPPGSGKTTYCHGIQQFYKQIHRSAVIINLDPANDMFPYECSVDVSELITVAEVMDSLNLGPNGALLYCIQFLDKHFEWLATKLKDLSGQYLIFDCPGQVELYTHENSMKNIVDRLGRLNLQLTAVHLVDSHHCSDVSNFIAVTLTSLNTMLQIALPAVNVLSKIDLVEKDEKLHFNLDFYTEIPSLDRLLDVMPDSPFMAKHKKLCRVLAGVIDDDDRRLVDFVPLNIQDRESVMAVVKRVDTANGYVFGSNEERNVQKLLSTAIGVESDFFTVANMQERYVDKST